MSNAKRNTTVNATNRDERDATNPVTFPTVANPNINKPVSSTVVSLKQILATNKIKTDPKLIRRVLRKYYASKINHQHRDAWMFPSDHVPTVIALIDKHCRANTPAVKS
jgi:hypothetical protein